MELKEINDQILDGYVSQSNKPHFMQTSAWKDVGNDRGYIGHNMGLYNNDNELVATAMLLEKKIGPFSTYYCPRGFICNYYDKELLISFIEKLKGYVKKNHGLYLKIDPDLIIHKLDSDADVIETFDDNLKLIDFLKQNGATHRGFTTSFSESSSPRYTFRVNIKQSEDDLFNNLHNTTKKILKEKNPYNIKISKNETDALEHFYSIMAETAKRKQMYLEPKNYFDNFYKYLADKGQSDIYVASVDTNDLKKIYQQKLDAWNKEYETVSLRPDGPKKENKLKDLANKQNRILKEKKEIDELKSEKIYLSAIITAKFADKVWTIHGGNSDQLLFLNANYELYYHILLDSKAMGYDYVDFYGSEGKVDKNSPIYGIYLFKLRFGGDFDEFIGEFDFIVRPFFYSLITSLLKIRRRIKYKLSLRKNKHD